MLGFVLGLIGHMSNHLIDSWENTPRQWRLMTRYAIGSIIVAFTFYDSCRRRYDKDTAEEYTNRLMGANWKVGLGVAVAWFIDDIITHYILGEKRNE